MSLSSRDLGAKIRYFRSFFFSLLSLTRPFFRLITYTCSSSTRNRNNPVEDRNIMMASVKDSVA